MTDEFARDRPPIRTSADVTARTEALAERANGLKKAFVPPAEPPDKERALRYLREGVGEAIAVYIESRTGEGAPTTIDPTTFAQLEDALNEWLELYAACYGTDIDAQFTVREAAELLVATHDLTDVARLLTQVPRRE